MTTSGTASWICRPRWRSRPEGSRTSSPSRTRPLTSSRFSGRSRALIQNKSSTSPPVHFHYTPTSASWLNQVEGFFGILGKQSLSETDFRSKKALREHISAYMRDWNKHPTPFAWTKPANAIIKSHRRMLDRITTAVHWCATESILTARPMESALTPVQRMDPCIHGFSCKRSLLA